MSLWVIVLSRAVIAEALFMPTFLRLFVVYIGVILMVYTVPDRESTLHILSIHLLKVLDIMVFISLYEVL